MRLWKKRRVDIRCLQKVRNTVGAKEPEYMEVRKSRKTRLRWFGHVKCKTWSNVVEEVIRKLNITKDMAEIKKTVEATHITSKKTRD